MSVSHWLTVMRDPATALQNMGRVGFGPWRRQQLMLSNPRVNTDNAARQRYSRRGWARGRPAGYAQTVDVSDMGIVFRGWLTVCRT